MYSGVPKPRKVLSMSRLLRGHSVLTHDNTVANLVHGVGERVLYVNAQLDTPPAPKRGAFTQLRVYRDHIARKVGRQSPVTRKQFADFYTGPRHATYSRAVCGLELVPVRPKDAWLKTFVKAEKHNISIKPNVVPRVIQPRDPRYNVEVGRYLKPVEHRIYREIDKLFGGPTIMSEYNSFTQAKHLYTKFQKFSKPAVVGLDASRFDQHVSADALRFEHSLYDLIFKSPELRRLLEWQIYNVGNARASDGYFCYTKKGSRMSGDMNTSLGNKILMCLMSKAYITTLGVPVEFVNNGDDCLLMLEREHLPKLKGLKKFFLGFGFNIVTESPVTEFEQVEFCQTKPVFANGVWRMVRNVKTCLTKDVTCVTLGHSVKEYKRWLYDIGNCGLATCADVPVLGSFYRMLKRFGEKGNYGGSFDSDYKWYKLSSRNAVCHHETPDEYGRYSFWKATGIVPDAQLELEAYFDRSVWGDDKRQLVENIGDLLQ